MGIRMLTCDECLRTLAESEFVETVEENLCWECAAGWDDCDNEDWDDYDDEEYSPDGHEIR